LVHLVKSTTAVLLLVLIVLIKVAVDQSRDGAYFRWELYKYDNK